MKTVVIKILETIWVVISFVMITIFDVLWVVMLFINKSIRILNGKILCMIDKEYSQIVKHECNELVNNNYKVYIDLLYPTNKEEES